MKQFLGKESILDKDIEESKGEPLMQQEIKDL
jgi:hypothetical protein